MATVIREVTASRPVENPEGKLSSDRTFIVFDDATPSNISRPDQIIALFGSTFTETMPNFGDEFPSIPELKAIDYSGPRKLDDGNPYVWQITWNYRRSEGIGPGGFNPGQPGYWEYNYSATVEIEDAWRDSPGLAFPADGIPVGGTDVGGVSIDSCGEPGSAFRMVQNLDITEVVAGQYTPANSFSFLKKRNNNTFLGANKGRLVYAGIVASSRIDTGIFSITHRMIWDEWFHLRQRVLRSSSGEPFKKSIPGVPIGTDWVAEGVKWYQPFPTLANFDSISSNWP